PLRTDSLRPPGIRSPAPLDDGCQKNDGAPERLNQKFHSVGKTAAGVEVGYCSMDRSSWQLILFRGNGHRAYPEFKRHARKYPHARVALVHALSSYGYCCAIEKAYGCVPNGTNSVRTSPSRLMVCMAKPSSPPQGSQLVASPTCQVMPSCWNTRPLCQCPTSMCFTPSLCRMSISRERYGSFITQYGLESGGKLPSRNTGMC